jgi:aspartate/methionine/tyrosine aminotransferase
MSNSRSAKDLCASLLEKTGVLILPPRLFRSDFAALPADRFRVGFTRPNTEEALGLFEQHLRDAGLT